VLDYIIAAQPRVVLELLGALDLAEEELHRAGLPTGRGSSTKRSHR
jgi:hypothetical protein